MTARLPHVITLPAAATVQMDHLRVALGQPSRQVLHLWRRDQAFPLVHGKGADRFCITDQIERWARAQGSTVRRV